jgi:hypothetical protein
MVSEWVLIQLIQIYVGNEYLLWTIGITDDPARRKVEHGNPNTWHDWEADSEEEAKRVEKHFLDKGMKGDVGGGINPKWVYIFRY